MSKLSQSHSAAASIQPRIASARRMSASTSRSLRGERAQRLERRRAGLGALEKNFRLLEREAGPLRGLEDLDAPDSVVAVAAPAALALGLGKNADALVVADRRRVHAEFRGELSDRERGVHQRT